MPAAVLLDIQIRGTREIIAKLARHPAVLHTAARRAGDYLRDRVRDKLSGPILKQRSGKLWASIESSVTGAYPVLNMRIFSSLFYAEVHTEGRVIIPKRRKVLKFTIGSETKFARQVVIPKRPFIDPTVRENLATVETIIEREIARALK